MEFSRSLPVLAEPKARIGHWVEFHEPFPPDEIAKQGARCMNCGVPFCHAGNITDGVTTGCPLHNLIPDWNDLVYRGRWREAYDALALTNNFPEFTGRVCPAPCETSCVLGINEDPVMIKEIEVAIIDRAFSEGWVKPRIPYKRTGMQIAIVGSGPAGLACADELNQFGHDVTVFERDDRIGGLLMYGIPNMKLEKALVERRVDLMSQEGIVFRTSVGVGENISAADLKENFDAIVLCCGAPKPRDLQIEGRQLNGVHFAMDFLSSATKTLLDPQSVPFINVKGKNVIVIGGGDTGTDCVATSLRQGCKSLTQFELMPRPAEKTISHDSWLGRIRTFHVDYGQQESAAVFGSDPRQYSVLTKRFAADHAGNLSGLETVDVNWENGTLHEIEGTTRFWSAETVLLAMGFVGVEKDSIFDDLGVTLSARNTITVNEDKQTNVEKIFAAGDCERGQSLIVWAIADGRKAAASVHKYLSEVVGAFSNL